MTAVTRPPGAPPPTVSAAEVRANVPLTLPTPMGRTLNEMSEWMGSPTQVPAARVVMAVVMECGFLPGSARGCGRAAWGAGVQPGGRRARRIVIWPAA